MKSQKALFFVIASAAKQSGQPWLSAMVGLLRHLIPRNDWFNDILMKSPTFG
jgi:hypothetical protein